MGTVIPADLIFGNLCDDILESRFESPGVPFSFDENFFNAYSVLTFENKLDEFSDVGSRKVVVLAERTEVWRTRQYDASDMQSHPLNAIELRY